MPAMKKKLVSLSEPLFEFVTHQAKKHGVSVSEEIRGIISKEKENEKTMPRTSKVKGS
jgi:macrodomain Ter protein organizer (MatP/YcbG family)